MRIDPETRLFEHKPSDKTEIEWCARIDLAALYRLVHLQGWDDLIFTHISMRVPGEDGHFLLNPFGRTFGSITASSLVKIDGQARPVDDDAAVDSPAGFVLHGAIHEARDDAHCVIHLHTRDGAALSSCKSGLMPLTQHAMIVGRELAYHDYEGVVLDLDERVRLVKSLGKKHLMLLRNHGTLALSPTCGGAWLLIYYLEQACAMQLRAMSATSDLLLPTEAVQARVRSQSDSWFDGSAGAYAWPGILDNLDSIDPSYRT